MNPDVIHMAHAIESISEIGDDGLIAFAYSESYGEAIGIEDLDRTEALMDEAIELLKDEGKVTEENGDYYIKEYRDEWLKREEEERIDAEQAALDARLSYGM